jgi:MerR family transcriptional regulator/heat shock protein HspR
VDPHGFTAPAGPTSPAGPFSDASYPAFTTGTAAELLGVAPGFLRGLGSAGLLAPNRSEGGHRRYSRHELELAARAREVVDEGMTLAAACRIVQLEAELARARQEIRELRRALKDRS